MYLYVCLYLHVRVVNIDIHVRVVNTDIGEIAAGGFVVNIQICVSIPTHACSTY